MAIVYRFNKKRKCLEKHPEGYTPNTLNRGREEKPRSLMATQGDFSLPVIF